MVILLSNYRDENVIKVDLSLDVVNVVTLFLKLVIRISCYITLYDNTMVFLFKQLCVPPIC